MGATDNLDVIVVGSGFGGSVAAARLAERGMRVLVLERGPWWGPLHRDRPTTEQRELPRGPVGARKLVRNVRKARAGRRSERMWHADGLLELHLFDHLNTVTSSGVGGGSHIYTNIHEEPQPEFFRVFPDEITAEEMRPYYDRVRAMLRPSPLPGRLERVRVFEEAAAAAGLPRPERPDLAVAWGDDPRHPQTIANAAGVSQSTSTYKVDAFVGCEDGSKTTLDLTYIPIALRRGAELRPLCEVEAVAAADRGYRVRYRDRRDRREYEVQAPRLVLAAGGLNTQRLLFRARDRDGTLPRISPALGRRFSPNGDFLAFLWRAQAIGDSSWGTSFNVFSRVETDAHPRFLIGEVGLAVDAMPLPWPLTAWLRRSIFLFCMGEAPANGTIHFDGEGLTTTAGRSLAGDLYEQMERTTSAVARHYHPKRIVNHMLAGRGPEGLFSVHPLGGCSIGRTADDGVTDHRGEVFGHPGLFVADGSLYPAAPGIAPSMTIAALAERQAALMA